MSQILKNVFTILLVECVFIGFPKPSLAQCDIKETLHNGSIHHETFVTYQYRRTTVSYYALAIRLALEVKNGTDSLYTCLFNFTSSKAGRCPTAIIFESKDALTTKLTLYRVRAVKTDNKDLMASELTARLTNDQVVFLRTRPIMAVKLLFDTQQQISIYFNDPTALRSRILCL